MPTLRIDNLEVTVPAGATILDAARKIGIDIPTLCHLDGCTPQTSCFVCLVKVNSSPRLLPSCATPAADGMIVESETPEVHAFRRQSLELLLSEHTGDCFAPCQAVCPAHMDIPTMMRQIASGDFKDAIVTVKTAIPLPATLGRICPELCEKGCRRGQRDDAVSICSLKRYVADKDLGSKSPYLPAKAPSTGKRVAIVGTGPAGLTAAWFLLQHGHEVVLYDNHPEAGGALRYCIDETRLPRQVLDDEIALVRNLGAKFVLNTPLAREPVSGFAPGKSTAPSVVTLANLQREFHAILLAIGPIDPDKALALGLDFAGTGVIIDKKTMMTHRRGIFAAGGAIHPLRHAIRAIADGQTVAAAIDDFLNARTIAGKLPNIASRMGKLSESELAVFLHDVSPVTRQTPHGGLSDALSDAAALAESNRCAHCDCGKFGGCKFRQISLKYNADPHRFRGLRRQYEKITTHPLITYEPGKCILCGLCIEIARQSSEPLGLTFIGRGFDVCVAAPMNVEIADALRSVATQCAQACPTGAMVMKKEAFDISCEQSDRHFHWSLPQLKNV